MFPQINLDGKNPAEVLDALLQLAVDARVTDIHMDPEETSALVRVRVDGRLYTLASWERSLLESLTAVVKVKASMRSDIHLLAQDGRFSVDCGEKRVDVRVAIAPTFFGENIVLRLLPKLLGSFSLEELGISLENRGKLQRATAKKTGMIIVTGPNGSGKTTTLYSLLAETGGREIAKVTLEDPVEYSVPGIRQIEVNSGAGFGFPDALKWIVRQNPDVLLLGEIRDTETARTALQTALSGHLLFTTLHTKDALSALFRLLEFGLEDFLVASCVNAVVAQRLVRRLCESCKQPDPESTAVVSELVGTSTSAWVGKGCVHCHNTGFHGRVGLFEVLEVSANVRGRLLTRKVASPYSEDNSKSSSSGLQSDGLEKVASGVTSWSEVLLATAHETEN